MSVGFLSTPLRFDLLVVALRGYSRRAAGAVGRPLCSGRVEQNARKAVSDKPQEARQLDTLCPVWMHERSSCRLQDTQAWLSHVASLVGRLRVAARTLYAHQQESARSNHQVALLIRDDSELNVILFSFLLRYTRPQSALADLASQRTTQRST